MKTVELDGKQYQVPDDASLSEIDSFIKGKVGATAPEEPASMTKQAAPTYDPYGTLGREAMGGMSDAGSGLSQVAEGLKAALTPPDPMNRGDKSNPVDGLVQAMAGIAKAGLGVLRTTVNAPTQALGDAAGEVTGEAARSKAEAVGMGPTGSAIIGTAVGAPINAAVQLWAVPYAIAKAAPKLLQGAQAVASRLPGAQVTLRRMAAKAVEAWPTIMAPAEASKDLYDKVAEINPKLVLPELNKIANKLDKLESVRAEFGLGNSAVQSTASKIAAATSGGAPGAYKEIPFNVAQDVMQTIGARVGELRASGGAALGDYKQLYKGMVQSLENAAQNSARPKEAKEAFDLLKQANKAANTEFSLGELQDIITKNVGKALEGTGSTSSNFGKALNDVNVMADKNPLFKKGLGDANFKTITDNLDQFRQLRLRPPPATAHYGSAPFWERASVGGLLGAGIGNILGDAKLGAEIGAAVSGGVPPLISRVVQSKAGTKALTGILEREGMNINPQHVAAIMAVIRGERALADGMPDEVTKALKGKDMSIAEKIQAISLQDTVFKTAEQAKRDLNP